MYIIEISNLSIFLRRLAELDLDNQVSWIYEDKSDYDHQVIIELSTSQLDAVSKLTRTWYGKNVTIERF